MSETAALSLLCSSDAAVLVHICLWGGGPRGGGGVRLLLLADPDGADNRGTEMGLGWYLLLLLRLGVDVSQHVDVREVYPELAEQSGHPAHKNTKQGALGEIRESNCKTFPIRGAVDRDKRAESSRRQGSGFK